MRAAALFVLLAALPAAALTKCRWTAPPDREAIFCAGASVVRVEGEWNGTDDPLDWFAAKRPGLKRTSFSFEGGRKVGTFVEKTSRGARATYVTADAHVKAVFECSPGTMDPEGLKTCGKLFALVTDGMPRAPARGLFPAGPLPEGCRVRDDGRQGLWCEDGVSFAWGYAHAADGIAQEKRRELLAGAIGELVGEDVGRADLELLDCLVAKRPARCVRVEGSLPGGLFRRHLVAGSIDVEDHALLAILDLGDSPYDPPPWADPLIRLLPKP